MRMTTATGIALVSVALTVAGCGSDSEDSPAVESSAVVATTPTGKPAAKIAPLPDNPGPNATVTGYLQQHGITRTQVHRGDPGAPTIDLPIPDGWADAGPNLPPGAYYAVVHTGAAAPTSVPSIVAWVSKLDGEVDQQQLLDVAAGQLRNLPEFREMSAGSASTLSGFPAYQFGGTWVQNGQKRMVAQKTVVIAADDGSYLLQMNVDCLESQLDVAVPATLAIDDQTKITT